VSYNADYFLDMTLGERTDGRNRPILHVDEPFAAGHNVSGSLGTDPGFEQTGIALPHFCKRQAIEVPDIHFDKRGLDLDGEAMGGGNRRSGVDRPQEGARVDGSQGLRAEGSGQTFGLPLARVVQGNVGATERERLAIRLGLAVTDEEEERG
jgi:hypothetical protein